MAGQSSANIKRDRSGQADPHVGRLCLYDNQFMYEGSEHLFSKWAADHAKLLCEEFERCYDSLAQEIVDAVLTMYFLPA